MAKQPTIKSLASAGPNAASRELANRGCASRLSEIADPTRLRVLLALFEQDRSVGALAKDLFIEQSLLSHHLRRLLDAGLVEARREGKSRVYSISKAVRAQGCLAGIDLGCCQIDFSNTLTPEASSDQSP